MNTADIRDGRYRIMTVTREAHEWVGRRVYQYLCAVYETDGSYIAEAAVEAEVVMRHAYRRRGTECEFSDKQTLEYIGCNHRVRCADCPTCPLTA